jgi:hypothetical protein
MKTITFNFRYLNPFSHEMSHFLNTVKLGYNELGYNELGYNEHSVITNQNIYLVGLGHFYDKFSRL